MKRAQSTWLTSLPCPPFQKYSHPAEQWQTRGFTRAALPPQLTDWAPFLHRRWLHPCSFSCHSASRLGHQSDSTSWDHPATRQTNKTLVAVVVLFPGLWILDRKSWLIWATGAAEKTFGNCRRGPPSASGTGFTALTYRLYTDPWLPLPIPSCLTPSSRKKVSVFSLFLYK